MSDEKKNDKITKDDWDPWVISGAALRGFGNYTLNVASSCVDFAWGIKSAAQGLRGPKFTDPAHAQDLKEASILSGLILLNEIPWNPASDEAREAYALAYPGLAAEESLEEAIDRLGDHPQALEGLLSGIKGKLMEIRSADLLEETLPIGLEVRLAESPTQSGHDLEWIAADGTIFGVAQVKATQSKDAILQHYQDHPDIPVITTRENAQALGDHPALAANQPDISLTDLDQEMEALAGATGSLDTLPLGASAVLVWHLGWSDGDLGDRLSAAGETLGRNTPAVIVAGLVSTVSPWWLVMFFAFGARWATGEGEKQRIKAWNEFKSRWGSVFIDVPAKIRRSM